MVVSCETPSPIGAGKLGGVLNVGNIDGDAIIDEGRGPHIWDVGRNEDVDFVLGLSPMFVDYNHSDMLANVQEQLPRDTVFFTNDELCIQYVLSIAQVDRTQKLAAFIAACRAGAGLSACNQSP